MDLTDDRPDASRLAIMNGSRNVSDSEQYSSREQTTYSTRVYSSPIRCDKSRGHFRPLQIHSPATFLQEHCLFSSPLSSAGKLLGHLGPPHNHSSPTLWHEHCLFASLFSSGRSRGHLGPPQSHSSPILWHEHWRGTRSRFTLS